MILLQLHGVSTHMGRYVVLVINEIFTKEELSNVTLETLLKDERCQIIKGEVKKSATIITHYILLCSEAVRSKFKLNHKMLLAEWSTLRERILQKET